MGLLLQTFLPIYLRHPGESRDPAVSSVRNDAGHNKRRFSLDPALRRHDAIGARRQTFSQENRRHREEDIRPTRRSRATKTNVRSYGPGLLRRPYGASARQVARKDAVINKGRPFRESGKPVSFVISLKKPNGIPGSRYACPGMTVYCGHCRSQKAPHAGGLALAAQVACFLRAGCLEQRR